MSGSTATLETATAPTRPSKGLTLHSRLVLLVLATILPLLSFELVNQYIGYQSYRARTAEQMMALARALAATVEQELQTRIAALQALALSPALRTGDLSAFRMQASGLVTQHFPGANILLLQENGQQLMNLAVAPGAPLPVRQSQDTLRKVFATGRPAVSDLYYGVVLNRPVIGIDVPVKDASGKVIYSLSFNPRDDVFTDVVLQQQLRAGLRVAVLDSQGTTIARSLDPENSVGQKTVPALLARMSAEQQGVLDTQARDGAKVMVAFSRLPRSGWYIAVAIPRGELTDPAWQSAQRMLAAGAGALILALAAAALIARRIAGPIADLQRLAAMIDRNGHPDVTQTGLREADDVARALNSAADRREVAERTLRESEARFRAIADNIPQLVWMAASDGTIFWYNRRWYDYTGVNAEAAEKSGWLSAVHPDHVDRVVERARRAWATGEPWEDTFPIRRSDGAWRWFLSRAVPIRDEVGTVRLWFGTNTDVTEQRASEERLKLLAAEVDHRAKNMLALVQVLVRHTRAADMQSLIRAIAGRVGALARAHALLSESRWQGADLERLAIEELAPFRAGGRMRAEGPPVALSSAAAQSVAMALHELATNAAKYGALSKAAGQIALGWHWRDDTLILTWTETGGPPVQPPLRRGLGTGVIERSIVQQLEGTIDFDWRPSGLACEIRLPARRLLVTRAVA